MVQEDVRTDCRQKVSHRRQMALPFAACEDRPYIFASYGHDDKDKVFPKLAELYEAGFNVWYDQGINIGADYDETIKSHILNSAAFVFFASSWSLSREYILDNELPAARNKHSDDHFFTLFLEDDVTVPERAACNIPDQRYASLEIIMEKLRDLDVENFGRRKAVPIERDVPLYWYDDYDIDPTGGTDSCVYTVQTPYVCLAFDPHDIPACNPYAKELFFAGYNVRSCENRSDRAREQIFTDPDCAAYVPFLTKKYIESGQLEKDYAMSKTAGKPLVALYMQTFDNQGMEETYHIPAAIADEFTAIQGLSTRERTVNDFLSELEAALEKRGCYTSMTDGKVDRRSFEIPGFLYDLTAENENKRKGIVLTKYAGNGSKVKIKRSYGGFPVRKIGQHSFANCTNLLSVDMADNINAIEEGAFLGCTGLSEAPLPSSIRSIGDYAFASCGNLESAIIPEGLETLGSFAFSHCGFTSIEIPRGIKYIRSHVFSDCGQLVYCKVLSDAFGESSDMFHNCSSLTTVELSDDITRIGAYAFSLCSSLASCRIPDSVTFIGRGAFLCSGLTSIIIPRLVTVIHDGTFFSCKNLSSVAIPDSIRQIEDEAFRECKSLASLTIPDSVYRIGNRALLGVGTVYCNRGSEAWRYCKRNRIQHKPTRRRIL